MLYDEVAKLYRAPDLEDMGDNNCRLWQAMYRDDYLYASPEIHHLSLPAAIATELARAAIIEFKSEVADAGEELAADYALALERLPAIVEQACAFGGVMLKPYVNKGGVLVDCVAPDLFVPLGVAGDGTINQVVFIDRANAFDDKGRRVFYTRLEVHQYESSDRYTIKNEAFRSDSRDSLGDPCALAAVDAWAGMAEELTLSGVAKPLYAYLKYPQANNLDPTSPLGMSCFCRAVALIQDADEQYSRIIWEYTGSELAIDADITALKAGKQMPAHGDRLFRNLGLDAQDGFYKVFSPAIRDESLFKGLNQILRRIEFNCGLSYGLLSDVNDMAKTATEMKIAKQRFYTTVSALQGSIREALEGVIYAMAILREETPPEEVSFDFDDSILIDSGEEQRIMLSEVAAGLLKPEVYLMRRYGVTEDQAREMMPLAEPANHEWDGEE
ncbi:phage portal protein [Peptococcus simiae]|uniref:phage capsid protein n=1 Tax=Peptococcus simiae TaxID=1643805 RepID=UPI00397EB22A